MFIDCFDGCRQRRSNKPTKVDKKFLLFGEKDGDEGSSSTSLKEENHFMASIQRTLREAMEGLMATAEVITIAMYSCSTYFEDNPGGCCKRPWKDS